MRRQQEAAERAEFERQSRERAEKEAAEKAKAKAEYDRQLAELRRKEAEEEAQRLEALKPDAEKLHSWANVVMKAAIENCPTLASMEAKLAHGLAMKRLEFVADELAKFGGPRS